MRALVVLAECAGWTILLLALFCGGCAAGEWSVKKIKRRKHD